MQPVLRLLLIAYNETARTFKSVNEPANKSISKSGRSVSWHKEDWVDEATGPCWYYLLHCNVFPMKRALAKYMLQQ